ncbi:MAG: DUF4258 domain-containing protein [Verrucomicrobia bacterium]|nr:DUF4258 domain-containing protein [Verrucomicrobiota bacterium]
MKPLDLEALRKAVREGRLEWRKHVLQKLAERGIAQSAVLEVLASGERIRDYTEDRPFPSALFLGYVGGRPLHVVASCDELNGQAFIITAYEPSLAVFEADYRTKRQS